MIETLTMLGAHPSCLPNSFVYWNNQQQRVTLHAIRPIEVGEELTVNFFQARPFELRDKRRELLYEHFGFVYSCAACLSPAHDNSLLEMKEIADRVDERRSGWYNVFATAEDLPLQIRDMARYTSLMAEAGLNGAFLAEQYFYYAQLLFAADKTNVNSHRVYLLGLLELLHCLGKDSGRYRFRMR